MWLLEMLDSSLVFSKHMDCRLLEGKQYKHIPSCGICYCQISELESRPGFWEETGEFLVSFNICVHAKYIGADS